MNPKPEGEDSTETGGHGPSSSSDQTWGFNRVRMPAQSEDQIEEEDTSGKHLR